MSDVQLETCKRSLREIPLLERDRIPLQGHLQALSQRASRGQPIDKSLVAWCKKFAACREKWSRFQSSVPQLSYPEDLPVTHRKEELVDAISTHPVVIVCGDTGSGKTTQLPKMMFQAGCGNRGRIGVTQPRRLAAMEMGRRVAEECGVRFGGTVGTKVRFDDKTSADTRIQFMTDGLLLAQLPQDPDWLEYGAILIDEAHERSLNIDFLLGCLRDLVRRRPDFSVVISSATLDAERFSDFFDQAPVITVEGRLHPIEDVYLPPSDDRDLDMADQVVEALEEMDRERAPTDTLIFLPGEREIRDTAKKLEGRYRGVADVLPLFARLGGADQQQVFAPSSRRRLVLATNVAETSLTIPGIRMVIDTGRARVQRFHPQSRIQRLVTERISKASAMQRRGRCGRTGPGICVRLYSEEELEGAPDQTDPEIRRSSLAEVILRMAVLGLGNLRDFPLIDPPKGSQLHEGNRTLMDIGALDGERNLTSRGRVLASFPLDPRLARMLEEGHHEQVLPAVLIVSAFLSIQDPRERPADQREAADTAHAGFRDPGSDFLGILNLWNALPGAGGGKGSRAKFCRTHFLHPARVREWIHLVDDLRETCEDHKWQVPASVGEVELLEPDALHRSLLAGIPRAVGVREERKEFRGPDGKTFQIFPGSALFSRSPRWIMAFTLLETTKLYARECAGIRPEWIEDVAPHLCKKQYERPQWNAKRGFVEAEERVSLGGLMLRAGAKVHYGRIDPEAAREIFLRDALEPGELRGRHPSFEAYRDLRESLCVWECKLRRPGGFLKTDALFDFFDRLIPSTLCTRKDFERWARNHSWVPTLSDLVEAELLPEAYPDDIDCNGARVDVRYRITPEDPVTDGITWVVREQDLPRLPDALLEWTVPGMRLELLEALIRTLEKPLRLACSPIAATAREAEAWLKKESFTYTHSLRDALAAFLAVKTGRILAGPDLHPESLPPHLRASIEVRDDQDRMVFHGEAFPGAETDIGIKGPRQKAVSGRWHRDGLTDWPENVEFLSEISLEGIPHWPVLVQEHESCCLRVFHQKTEAMAHHLEGVVQMFLSRRQDVVGYLEKRLPVPTLSLMELEMITPGEQALPDLVHGILREGLCPGGRPPVTSSEYQHLEEELRGTLFELAEERGRSLQELLTLRQDVMSALERRLPADTAADLELQMQTLWTPGWCRDPVSFQRYPRYLEGMKRRIQRCDLNPSKDLRKLSELDPALTRFSEILSRLRPFQVREGFLKLQELRLATFAPELKCFEKTSLKRFEDWTRSL